MLAGVQVNPAPLKNDRARGKKKEEVDHWWPIGVLGKTSGCLQRKMDLTLIWEVLFTWPLADLCGY